MKKLFITYIFITFISFISNSQCTGAPYGPDDYCYQEVINNDPFCCNTNWDFICQNTYDNCQPPVPCVNNFEFSTNNMPTISNQIVSSECIGFPVVSNGQFTDEYTIWENVQMGAVYQFSSSNNTDWITIRSGTPTGPVVEFGETDLLFTAILPGPYYVHLNSDPSCGNDGGCRDIEMELITALPIELKDFTAKKDSVLIQNNIEWSTYTERNNDYFTIERSADGINWTEIVTVNGAGSTTEEQKYTYSDRNFERNTINYYRLSQTDYDGTKSIEGIKSVNNQIERLLIKKVNLLGQEVDDTYKGIVIKVYSDNTTEKSFQRLK